MVNIISKPTFGFEIIFRLPEVEGYHQEGEISDLILPPNGNRVKLRIIKKPDSEEFDSLILKAGGFASENEASEYASKIKSSIYLSGLLLKSAFEIIQLSVREEGVIYISAHGKYSSSKPLDSFIEAFKRAIELRANLHAKESLALELYNISHFETSQCARFVTLISAIECLSEQKKRSDSVIAHLYNLTKSTCNSKLDKQDKNNLLDSLKWLEIESHSASCRNLIKKKLDKKAVNEFMKYYDIRGDIVHDGKPKKGIELGNELYGLDNLVYRLLVSTIILESNNLTGSPESLGTRGKVGGAHPT